MLFSKFRYFKNFEILTIYFYLLQVRLRIEDGGSPPRSSTSITVIRVQRNMLPPFFAGNFNTTILENTAVGVALKTVTATDNDPQVILTTI